jgi:hypothetical protein
MIGYSLATVARSARPVMAASEMLSRFSVLRSTDFEEAREIMTEVLTPHELEPVDGTRSLDARASVAPLASSSLLFLGYGARVRVTPDLGEDCYLVLLPKLGAVEFHHRANDPRATVEIRSQRRHRSHRAANVALQSGVARRCEQARFPLDIV